MSHAFLRSPFQVVRVTRVAPAALVVPALVLPVLPAPPVLLETPEVVETPALHLRACLLLSPVARQVREAVGGRVKREDKEGVAGEAVQNIPTPVQTLIPVQNSPEAVVVEDLAGATPALVAQLTAGAQRGGLGLEAVEMAARGIFPLVEVEVEGLLTVRQTRAIRAIRVVLEPLQLTLVNRLLQQDHILYLLPPGVLLT